MTKTAPPVDWEADDPPTSAEAAFAYWAFKPEDQPEPEWALPGTFESEEDYHDRMEGDDPERDFHALQRWQATDWEPGAK